MNIRLQKRQRGAATLVVAVVLLISITLVTILTAKTVLMETKIEANNYRTMQAVSAANYALDYGLNYFDNGGFDQYDETVNPAPTTLGSDGVVDNIYKLDDDADDDQLRLISDDLQQTTFATVSFDTGATRCAGTASWEDGLISATGFSDDRVATRTVSVCVGPLALLNDDVPDIPLISRSQVGLTGNANITNRYSNTNIWSGDTVEIGSSSSMETFIKDPATGPLDPGDPDDLARLLDTDPTLDTQMVSNNNLGNGLDIIDSDPSLGNLSATDFFNNFFGTDDMSVIEGLADNIGQSYTDIADAIGKSGLIYVAGDQSLNSNGMIGSIDGDGPAILIVDGDLRATGGPTIYGLVYVVGELTIAGTVSIVGSSIVEGAGATEPIVNGTGTLNLVYWKDFLEASDTLPPGLTTVIDGSWRDW